MRASDAPLLIVVLVIAWSLYKAHRRVENDFSLFDLLMENGRVSKIACVFLGSFAVFSWIMVRLTLDGKMTEGYIGLYGATWAAPLIAKLFSPAPMEREKP